MTTKPLVHPLDNDTDFERAIITKVTLLPLAPGCYTNIKVVLDFTIALALLLLTIPLLALTVLLIKLTSRGPAFYSQIRLGRAGRPFRIYKLRTMYHQCEQRSGVQWSTPGDARITFVGRFLRKTHLDELPQLWNVLRGDMSMVGPRPERPEFVPGLQQAIPNYAGRLLVRPGITGLAQVQLPPDTDLNSVRRKVHYDLYYIRQLTFLLDLRLMVATALQCLGVGTSVRCALFRVPGAQFVEQSSSHLVAQLETAVRDSGAESIPELARA
jgi:lipopolysaccharide/colanic/teichoic acid biosynthesis glycosyltransferase